MAKNLVIVESPAKAKTINKYLGRGYSVKASMGHVRDLPKKKLGVDARNYHALHWRQYSHLQLGRFAEAREELELMRSMAAESRSPKALWYYAAMRAGLVVESGKAFPTPPSLGGGVESARWRRR